MRKNLSWPGKEDPITSITFELVVGFDEDGQPIYKRGRIRDGRELEVVQTILEPLQPHPAQITSKTMGKVELELVSGARVMIRPVFHRPCCVYKDLFKVDNFDCPMPAEFADMLNRWHRQLLNIRDSDQL